MDKREPVSWIGLATAGFGSGVFEELLTNNDGDRDGAEVGMEVHVVGTKEPMSPPASCDTRAEA